MNQFFQWVSDETEILLKSTVLSDETAKNREGEKKGR